MKHKKSVLKILSANSECFRVSAGIAPNTIIDATKPKHNMATALGIWYVQIPNNFIIDPFGNVVEPKVYKGNRVIIKNRKQVSVSKLPHLNFNNTMNFKNIFCNATKN